MTMRAECLTPTILLITDPIEIIVIDHAEHPSEN